MDYEELAERAEEKNAFLPAPNSNAQIGDAKQSISFYVAECGEFHNLGEYHDNLTLPDAIERFKAIPHERLSAGKAIGFELQTGLEGVFADASMELFYFNKIGMDTVEYVEWIRGNELIWDAMKELAEAFPDAEIENRESIRRLATDLDVFMEDFDPYEYWDNVEEHREHVGNIVDMIETHETGDIVKLLESVISGDEDDPKELVDSAKDLLGRINDIYLRGEQNPLTKVEELEEGNYNQIDGVLNNIEPPKEIVKDAPKSSIHQRLEQARETLANEQKDSSPKAASKGREELGN